MEFFSVGARQNYHALYAAGRQVLMANYLRFAGGGIGGVGGVSCLLALSYQDRRWLVAGVMCAVITTIIMGVESWSLFDHEGALPQVQEAIRATWRTLRWDDETIQELARLARLEVSAHPADFRLNRPLVAVLADGIGREALRNGGRGYLEGTAGRHYQSLLRHAGSAYLSVRGGVLVMALLAERWIGLVPPDFSWAACLWALVLLWEVDRLGHRGALRVAQARVRPVLRRSIRSMREMELLMAVTSHPSQVPLWLAPIPRLLHREVERRWSQVRRAQQGVAI